MQGDRDVAAIAGQRLVDRVIDNFLDKVVQTTFTHVADIHGRTLPDGLETFEDLDGIFAIALRVAEFLSHVSS
jgi:hypothetical protein